MIEVNIKRNASNEIYTVTAKSHGDPIVCSAVSALMINAVNSVKNLTDEKMDYRYNENGGFLQIELPEIKQGNHNHDASLLLDSLVLGLTSIQKEYGRDIKITDNNSGLPL